MQLTPVVNIWREPAAQRFCQQFTKLLETWPRSIATDDTPLSSKERLAHEKARATAQALCEQTQHFFERRIRTLRLTPADLDMASLQGRLAGQWHAHACDRAEAEELRESLAQPDDSDPDALDERAYLDWIRQESLLHEAPRWSFLSVPQPSRWSARLSRPVEFDLGQCGNAYLRSDVLFHPLMAAARTGHHPALLWLLDAGAPPVLHFIDTNNPAHATQYDWTQANWCWLGERAAEAGMQQALGPLCRGLRGRAVEQQCGAWIDGCIAHATHHPIAPATLHTLLVQTRPFLSLGDKDRSANGPGPSLTGLPRAHEGTPLASLPSEVSLASASASRAGDSMEPLIALAPGVIESSFELVWQSDFAPRRSDLLQHSIAQRQELSRTAFQALLEVAPLERWPLSSDTTQDEMWAHYPASLMDPNPSDPILAGNLSKMALVASQGAYWLLEDMAQAPHCRWLSSEEIDAIDWPTGESFAPTEGEPPTMTNASQARALLERHALGITLRTADTANPSLALGRVEDPNAVSRRPAAKPRRAL